MIKKNIINIENIINKFDIGFDCGQIVLSEFSNNINIKYEDALKIASGFGGGIFHGKVCGAISGAIIVLGMKYGSFKENDFETKKKLTNIIGEFINIFTERFGSTECKELLKYDISKKEDFEEIMKKDLFHTFCPNVVQFSIETLNNLIQKYDNL